MIDFFSKHKIERQRFKGERNMIKIGTNAFSIKIMYHVIRNNEEKETKYRIGK